MSVFCKDFKKGDILTAGDLNEMVRVVQGLEVTAAGAAGGFMVGGRGDAVLQARWPFEVTVGFDAAGERVLRVAAGRVLVDYNTEEGFVYDELPVGDDGFALVEGYAGEDGPVTVWLQLVGEIKETHLDDGGDGWTWFGEPVRRVVWTRRELRVSTEEVEGVVRRWPLAVVNCAHVQPVTQLLWGDLNALEVRGFVRTDGEVVWPGCTPDGALRRPEVHVPLATVNFSGTVSESFSVSGVLRGGMAADGAFSFQLGAPVESDAWAGGAWDEPDAEWDEEEDDDEAGGYGDFEDETVEELEPGSPTVVRYGYLVQPGDGFSECTLSTTEDGDVCWRLVLDEGFLAEVLEDLAGAATVTVTAEGSVPGAHATVEMGLGGLTVTNESAAAELVFHGTNAVDASTKVMTKAVKYVVRPDWAQQKEWLISPSKVATAGRYVQRAEVAAPENGFVQASRWFRFRVDRAAFRQAAEDFLRAELGRVTLSGTVGDESNGCTVTGTLSGSLLKAKFALKLA